jgi:competence protein ComEC
VVTKRDLARFGSATVVFSRMDASGGHLADTGALQAEIQYAIQWPYRPWETQRRFSREARGLPPYRSKKAGPGDAAE